MSIVPVGPRVVPANCGSARGVSNGFCVIRSSQSRSRFRLNARAAAEVRTKRLGDFYRAVFLLELLEDRDERAPDREARSVERVHERRLSLLLLAPANLRPSRLEVLEVRAARDLSIC